MKIAVIGMGFLGKAMHEMLADQYEVTCIDVETVNGICMDEVERVIEANGADLAILCLPTPMCAKHLPAMLESGGSFDIVPADLSAIEWWVDRLNVPILIKSTVPPGTTAKLRDKYGPGKRICFSPEFGGESKYWTSPWKYVHPTDFKSHPFMVIAGPDEETNFIAQIFLRVLGPEKEIVVTPFIAEAEMMKYIVNSWGAMKVTIWNEYWEMCRALGLNFLRVRELALLDPRLERMHTAVFEDKRGFGGKCFPKDVNALAAALIEAGYEPKMLIAAIRKNEELRDN